MAVKRFLSIYTVETHRKNIMQKLRLKTPAALM
jgi:two-component system nitrate/nitrite response regulator NarL